VSDFKLVASQHSQDVLTLETAWAAYFPKYSVVEKRFLRMWLQHNSLSTVLAAFEFASQDSFYTDGIHLGRVITNLLRSVTFTT